MTFASKITITRILMVPVYALLALAYGRSVASGVSDETLRWWALGVFVSAAGSDGIDGWVARRFNQISKLGAFIDPIADKGLLLAGIITLSVSNWQYEFPVWFPVLVISRDLILLVGTVLIHMLAGKMVPRPRFVGKCATLFQMITLGWVLLKVHQPSYLWPLYAAGFFTLVSGIWYIFDGVRQLSAHEAKKS